MKRTDKTGSPRSYKGTPPTPQATHLTQTTRGARRLRAYKWPSIEGAEARRELGEGGGQLRPRVWSVSPRSSCQGRCCQGDEPYDSVARSRRLGVLLRWLGLGSGLACGG